MSFDDFFFHFLLLNKYLLKIHCPYYCYYYYYELYNNPSYSTFTHHKITKTFSLYYNEPFYITLLKYNKTI